MPFDIETITGTDGYVDAYIHGFFDPKSEQMKYAASIKRQDGKFGTFEIASSEKTTPQTDGVYDAAPFKALSLLLETLRENAESRIRINTDNEAVKNYCDMSELQRDLVIADLPEPGMSRPSAAVDAIKELNIAFKGRDVTAYLVSDGLKLRYLNRAKEIAKNPKKIPAKILLEKPDTQHGLMPEAMDVMNPEYPILS